MCLELGLEQLHGADDDHDFEALIEVEETKEIHELFLIRFKVSVGLAEGASLGV